MPAPPAAPEGRTSPPPPAALAQRDPAAPAAAADRPEAARDSSAAAAKPARKPANCPRQLRPLAQPVYFKTDASSIASEDRSRLQRLGECLGRSRVRIVGHADPRHTDEYNQELSERRARAVADVLTAAGADPSRISVVGAGKSKPSSKKPSRQALQRARRVDIQIR
jgi:OmpA-OmpF porin, OOP family